MTKVVMKAAKKKAGKTVPKAVARETGARRPSRTQAAARQTRQESRAGAGADTDIYLPLLQKRWAALRKAYHSYKDRTLLEYSVDHDRVRAYGISYLDTLSDRTREEAKRQYRRGLDEGVMMVFVRDAARQVLRSYLLLDEEKWPGLVKADERRGIAAVTIVDFIDEAFYATWAALHEIYTRYRRQHRENPDSEQLCCMWSTDDPPDVIEDTEPLYDIEETFDIEITGDDALQLYDMELDQAARMIIRLRNKQRAPWPRTGR